MSLSLSQKILLITLFALPLVTLGGLPDPSFAIRSVILAGSTASLLLLSLRREQQELQLDTLITGALLLFFLTAVTSSFSAANTGEAVQWSCFVGLCVGWFAVFARVGSRQLIVDASRWVTALAAVLSLIGLAQYFSLGFAWIPGAFAPYATIMTKNLFSSFLFLTLAFSLQTALADRKHWRMAGIVVFGLSIFTLVITQTRAAWLGAAAMFLVSGAVALWSKRSALPDSVEEKSDLKAGALATGELTKGALRKSMQLAAAVGAAGIFLAVGLHLGQRMERGDVSAGERAASLFHYQSDESAMMRLVAWRKSARMLSDHPVTGVGGGNWKVAVGKYGLADFSTNVQNGVYQWTHPHSDLLAAFAEQGVPGGNAYALLFLGGIAAAARGARLADSRETRLRYITIAGAIAGFAVISALDFPRERVEHMMLFMTLLAMAATADATSEANAAWRHLRITPRLWRISALTLTVVAVAAGVIGVVRLGSERHQYNTLEARENQDWRRSEEESRRAYVPDLVTLDVSGRPLRYYTAEAEFMMGDPSSALRSNLDALHDAPFDMEVLNDLGSASVQLRNFDRAEVFYSRALAISPRYEESLLNLAALSYNAQQYERAARYLAQCDTSQPGSRAQTYSRALRAHMTK